jgi:hypothetical protein
MSEAISRVKADIAGKESSSSSRLINRNLRQTRGSSCGPQLCWCSEILRSEPSSLRRTRMPGSTGPCGCC